MPAPGDQHTAWKNPFEENKPRISYWTASDIASIAAKLEKQLGPEYISARSGPGGSRVHYLTAEKCIALANEVFGFNGWSSSIQNIQVDFADENPQTQRVSIGLSVIVRVTLRDGSYHEDIGYGSIENAKGKAMAFEKAKKEGTTDGLKRALRNFGNILGNCIYDQEYVKQVVKVKVQPVRKFDEQNLHRHSSFVKTTEAPKPLPTPTTHLSAAAQPGPVPKLEATESLDDFLGELDEADFCVPEDGHPDEIILPSLGANHEKSGDGKATPRPVPGRTNHITGAPTSIPIGSSTPRRPENTGGQPSSASFTVPDGPVAFFSAKAVSHMPDSSIQDAKSAPLAQPQGRQLFNPKAESPSIRKTPGIDHNSSKPVARNGQHVPPNSSQSESQPSAGGFTPVRTSNAGETPSKMGMANPSLDFTRRIGAPGRPASPLANRNAYKPPSMKRPMPEATTPSGPRQPLSEIPLSNGLNATAGVPDGLDAKRQKMG